MQFPGPGRIPFPRTTGPSFPTWAEGVTAPFSGVVVYGVPQPQGSKTPMGLRGGRHVLVESNAVRLRPWRALVTAGAVEFIGADPNARGCPMDGPLSLLLTFTMPRPKSAPKRVTRPFRKPDLSKLIRAVEDALTDAGVWHDDAQIVTVTATKRYVGDAMALDRPGVEIGVYSL